MSSNVCIISFYWSTWFWFVPMELQRPINGVALFEKIKSLETNIVFDKNFRIFLRRERKTWDKLTVDRTNWTSQ